MVVHKQRAGDLLPCRFRRNPAVTNDVGHLHRNPRARAGLARHRQLSPQRAYPLAHPAGPHARSDLLRVEAPPIVGDIDPEPVTMRLEYDPHPAGARVAPGVRQGLLNDAQELLSGPPGQLLGEAFAHLQLHLAAGVHLPVQLDECLDGPGKGAAARRLRAEVVDRRSQTAHGASQGSLHVSQSPVALTRAGVRPGELHRLQGVDEVLEDLVVQVAGYAASLGFPNLLHGLLGLLELRDVPDTPMTPATSPR